MEQTVSLDAEKYEEFIRCLSVLKEHCSDADIREGVIRQRGNENTSVFEIDMSSIIEDISLPISDLKQKLDLLKMFSDQEVTISVIIPDGETGYFTVGDQYSSLKFIRPDLEYMDNKFMSQEERESVFQLNEEDLILSNDISSFISDRMKVVATGFNINTVEITINGEEANISAKTQASDQFAKFVEGIVTDKVLECSSNMVITPFIIDHDGDITFRMYNTADGISSNSFSTSIADIPINMYTRSTLTDNSE
ncbi:hypothetical protein KAR91_25005 [Candidatus Pacearchaeota archaeon]|nr:hypothetical protein [Candidatus Pacearchaeota archaeon]